ncbi:hypothetical protein ABE438_02250 [Bosea sp. TWI1241]
MADIPERARSIRTAIGDDTPNAARQEDREGWRFFDGSVIEPHHQGPVT